MTTSGIGCSSGRLQTLKCMKRKSADNVYEGELLFNVSGSSTSSRVKTIGRLDDESGKGQKMDTDKTRQCSTILKRLMTHKNGWVFNQPVDPVKLNIPDYFSIISRPMDLGTIKTRLERKLYSSTRQFAEDVWLTFANGMQYNPPGNPFHFMAKELNNMFNSRWKELEVSWWMECSVQQSTLKRTQKKVITSKDLPQIKSAFKASSMQRKSLTSAEKLKLSKQLAELPVDKMPPSLHGFLQRNCLLPQNGNTIHLDITVLDDKTLWELNQILRNCLDARCTNSADDGRKSSQGSVKIVRKGGVGNILRYDSVKSNALTSHTVSKNTTVDNCCSRQNDLTQSSYSDLYSERSSAYSHNLIVSRKESTTTERSRKGNLSCDVDRASVVTDGDNAQRSFHPPSPAVPFQGDYPPCEQQVSPSRALRAALLKSRFAATIVKAQHKTLLNHGAKGDQVKMQREKEKLEKEQQKEKARIEAEIKASEAAAQMRADAELNARREMEAVIKMKAEAERKEQREIEREAARLSLQKMEQTVHINENSRVFKDLEDLASAGSQLDPEVPHGSVFHYVDGQELQSGNGRNPLEKLGLFIKDDDLDEEDLLAGDVSPPEQSDLFDKEDLFLPESDDASPMEQSDLFDQDDMLQPQTGDASLMEQSGRFGKETLLQSQVRHLNPLEQLGYFVKEDHGKEAEDWSSPTEDSDVEEGEIL